MPYPTEHAARLVDPGKYARFRREDNKFGPGVHAIWGVTEDGTAELQAIRFDKTTFSAAKARAWCAEHDHTPILFEPASDKEASLLCGPDGSPAPVSHEVMQDGVARKRFRKDLIAVGIYKHPKLDWTLDATTERMDRWVAAFKRMTTAGIRVPVPAGHSYDPRDGQGFLVELAREGDKLFGVLEMVGDEAISLAYRTQQVSISVNPDFTDGTGTYYGEVIEHVALTGYPVVPGQENFRAIAASLIPPGTKGVSHMTPEMMDKFRKLLGLPADADEAAIVAAIEKRLEAADASKLDQDKKITDLSAEVESLKAQVKAASSKSDEKKVDPDLLDERAETGEEKIDGLVTKGKILPAVAASLKAALVGGAGSRNAFCLSRTVSGTPESILSQVVKALDQNDPVKLGEQTKSQELSRMVPGSDGASVADPEIVKQMVGAGGSAQA